MTAAVDTNVLVAAFQSRLGSSFWMIDEFMAGRASWSWVVSNACIAEYEEILLRRGLPGESVGRFLDDLVARADRIARVQRLRPLLPDPDDEFLAELVLSADADVLVTFNKADFRSLTTFGVRLATPAEFRKILEQQ